MSGSLHRKHAALTRAAPIPRLETMVASPNALQALGRATGPRQAVLSAIEGAQGPFTIEEILQATPGVGRATVFRTIKRLHQGELLCRLQLEDGEIRYQLSSSGHHHHFICSTCGVVTDFSDPVLDELIQGKAGDARFELTGHSVDLYGHCAECRAAATA